MRRENTAWYAQAICSQIDPDMWVADKPLPSEVQMLLSICMSCPVRQECAEFAITNHHDHGIWGGLMPRERMAIRRKRNRDRS